MSKFIFENKKKLAFKDCSATEREAIVNAMISGDYDVLASEFGGQWRGIMNADRVWFNIAYAIKENPRTLEDATKEIKEMQFIGKDCEEIRAQILHLLSKVTDK